MTPEERNLVTELFDRLATLEDAPRDREAERLVQDGLRQAPNAPYALVQTVLVQDEALKRADARIRELEGRLGTAPTPQGGFLDSMRESVWGRREPPRAGSVPTVRPAGEPTSAPMGAPLGAPGYRAEAQPMGQPASAPGGSFLGTAAATAVGVIGGSLLMSSIRSMMGGQQGGTAHAAYNPPSGSSSPWGAGGEGNLAREAGVDDIGRGAGSHGDAGRSHGLMDNDAAATTNETADASYAVADENDAGDLGEAEDFGGDFGSDEE